jgi:CheY-like chemotaxis protein
VRSLLNEFLKSVGYSVYQAGDGKEAVGILRDRSDIDLLIVDYAMPGMNGLETIRQARLERPDLRFLLITGHAGISNTDITGIPLLRKPFTPAELAEQAAKILGAR